MVVLVVRGFIADPQTRLEHAIAQIQRTNRLRNITGKSDDEIAEINEEMRRNGWELVSVSTLRPGGVARRVARYRYNADLAEEQARG